MDVAGYFKVKRVEYTWIPKVIIGFFIVIAITDAAFIYLAEVTNRAAIAAPKQKASQVYFQQQPGKNQGKIMFIFKGEDGLPVIASEVIAQLQHVGSAARNDVILKPISGMMGRYTADIELCCAGEWQVAVDTTNPKTHHKFSIIVQ